jgi:hypothetical protein
MYTSGLQLIACLRSRGSERKQGQLGDNLLKANRKYVPLTEHHCKVRQLHNQYILKQKQLSSWM